MPATSEFQQRLERIEGLVQQLESVADPPLRRIARELVESLMEIHGAGFERLLEMISTAHEAGAGLVQEIANDDLICSLLVLYGLHPLDFETRVRRGVDRARPVLRSHGARIDHVAITAGVVRLKIVGPAVDGLEAAVREAVLSTAPDAAEVVIEEAKAVGHSSSFVPLSAIRTLPTGREAAPTLNARS
jgi:hypothetical protein